YSPTEIVDIFRANANYVRQCNVQRTGQEIAALREGLEAFTAAYVGRVEKKLKTGTPVSPEEIDNIKTLDRLDLYAREDCTGPGFISKLRKFEEGIGATGVSNRWRKIEKIAGHADLLTHFAGERRVGRSHRWDS